MSSLGAKKSETVYSGNEGEEKAQTTYNFNFDGSLRRPPGRLSRRGVARLAPGPF